jgi:excisionase family DNA binding protein
MPVEKLVYTVAEASEALGLSTRAVYDLCRKGELPARRVGKKWLISKEGLRAYLMHPGSQVIPPV